MYAPRKNNGIFTYLAVALLTLNYGEELGLITLETLAQALQQQVDFSLRQTPKKHLRQ